MLIRTEELTPEHASALSEPDSHQIYCGLDCAVTFEVHEALNNVLGVTDADNDAQYPLHYSFERALQAPALDMMLRGFKIDGFERARGIAAKRSEREALQVQLDEIAHAVWDRGLNPNSPKQLKEFFYSRMRLPEVWISQKGERKLSTNREALEKLDLYFHARPLIALILDIRELTKLLSVLETEVSRDGRMRTSYNIGGTSVGRWSSSSDVTGVGTNLQNITPELRRMFIADDGWKICGIDLEQSEGRDVGFLIGILFDDWTYLDACEQGDLHTTTARLVWPTLPWTGDKKLDREIAERAFYRHFSYRDMSKRGGHATNYLTTPFTMARHLKIPIPISENFQSSYFGAYPGIPRWHVWTAEQLQRHGTLTTPFGRSRQFFGRPDDDATIRKAVAYRPAAMTGDRLNLGLWRIGRYMPQVELLAQVHDAVYFQYRECSLEEENAIIAQALSLIHVELKHKNRTFVVPGEAKIGWNWASADSGSDESHWRFPDGNPDGLVKWNPTKPDTRTRSPSGMDRRMF